MESIYSGISDVVNLWAVCRGGTRALGPGNRYVLWTQGCLHRCPGCVSPESRPFVPRLILSVDEIARDIISRKDIDGVTVSGGEAFLQSEALTALFSAVKRERPDLSVLIFTGYTLEELTGEDDKALLSLTDVLIDGPFVESLRTSDGLRGSSNQRVIFLTPRLLPHKEELLSGEQLRETIPLGNGTITIGIPEKKAQSDHFTHNTKRV